MTKPWCVLPFIHMYASDPVHDDKVCCVATQKIKDYASTPDTWLEDKWNGEYMVDLRKRMLTEGSSFPECQECINAELNGGVSDRMMFNDNYQDTFTPNIETGNEHHTPIYWDLRPGNLCNLACRMCGPASSSQLNKEHKTNEIMKEMQPSENAYNAFMNIEDGCNWASETNIKYIENSLDNTRHIKFLGGEPTIMPEVARIMDTMIDKGVSEKLDKLHITTNGTNLNNKFYDRIAKYKNVNITLSIDGIYQTVEYIRHPLNFKSFTNNFETLIKNKNVSVSFNCAVQTLNLHNILDFTKWAINSSDNISLNFVKVHYPLESSTTALPKKYREKYCNEILSDDILKNDIVKHSNLSSVIKRVLEEDFEEFAYRKFVMQTVLFDKTRNQHVMNFVPEIWDIISTDYKVFNRDLKTNSNDSNMRQEWLLNEG